MPPRRAEAQLSSVGRATLVMTEEGEGEAAPAVPAHPQYDADGNPVDADGAPIPVMQPPSNKWDDPWPNKPDDATHSSRVHPSGAYRMVYQAFTPSECADIVKTTAHVSRAPEETHVRQVSEYKHIKDEEENRWIYHRVWGMAQEANSVQSDDDCEGAIGARLGHRRAFRDSDRLNLNLHVR
eukprot:SAG31_NODE_4119_length_3564_cov_2.071861_2_plen_182_part_00